MTGFLFILCVVLIGGIALTIINKGAPEQKIIEAPIEESFMEIVKNPKGAKQQGISDMFKYVLGQYYFPKNIALALVTYSFAESVSGEDSLQRLAELIAEKPERIKVYKDLDLNKGRTSRKYMATGSADEFADYISGGREVIESLDERISRIREEQEIEAARKKALEELDHQTNTVRKELRKLQDPVERREDDLEQFEKEMREIDEGK